jgi:hypothetical protein
MQSTPSLERSTLAERGAANEVGVGTSAALGASVTTGGVDFSVFSNPGPG